MNGLCRLSSFQHAEVQDRKLCGISFLEMKRRAKARLTTLEETMAKCLFPDKKNQTSGIISVFVKKEDIGGGGDVEHWKLQDGV